jgi:hypothetical protein
MQALKTTQGLPPPARSCDWLLSLEGSWKKCEGVFPAPREAAEKVSGARKARRAVTRPQPVNVLRRSV